MADIGASTQIECALLTIPRAQELIADVMVAAIRGRQPSVLQMLIDYGADANVHDPTGKAPIIIASSMEGPMHMGDETVWHTPLTERNTVDVLLYAGADPNVWYNSTRYSTLYFAVLAGCQRMFDQIMRHGADPGMCRDVSARSGRRVMLESYDRRIGDGPHEITATLHGMEEANLPMIMASYHAMNPALRVHADRYREPNRTRVDTLVRHRANRAHVLGIPPGMVVSINNAILARLRLLDEAPAKRYRTEEEAAVEDEEEEEEY